MTRDAYVDSTQKKFLLKARKDLSDYIKTIEEDTLGGFHLLFAPTFEAIPELEYVSWEQGKSYISSIKSDRFLIYPVSKVMLVVDEDKQILNVPDDLIPASKTSYIATPHLYIKNPKLAKAVVHSCEGIHRELCTMNEALETLIGSGRIYVYSGHTDVQPLDSH
jgi:hypothetical protein